jgi:serine protease Do
MKIRTALVVTFSLLLALATAALAAAGAPAPAGGSSPTEAGWLGVSLGSSAAEPGLGLEGTAEGVKVIGIAHGSPAQRAGLRVRDVILSVDGKPVSTPKDVIAIVTSLAPGATLSLNVSRKGQERLVTPSLATRPTDASLMKMFDGWIGVEAIELPSALREHFGAPADAGVMISAVKASGPAEAAGLAVGDVVFEMDGEPVRSLNTLRNLVASSGIDNRVEIRLMRDGAELVIEPVISSRPERDDTQ